MKDSIPIQDEPMLGIFWWDFDHNQLFGVYSVYASEVPFRSDSSLLKTVSILHRTLWEKRYPSLLRENSFLSTDFTQVPRGRVFQSRDGTFILKVGDWIESSPGVIDTYILSCIKAEFNLQGVQLEVDIDEHWNVGSGWSDEELS
jgi:hypothetical protein